MYREDYTDRFSYVEPSLQFWDKSYLIIVDDLFDVFMDSVWEYFIEYFFINVHEGNMCNSLSVLHLCVVLVSG